jgi:hypothetical protein
MPAASTTRGALKNTRNQGSNEHPTVRGFRHVEGTAVGERGQMPE